MNLSELHEELKKDMPIDFLNVQYEAGQNPILYGKWLRYMSDLKVQQKKLTNQKIKATKKRLEFYTGRGNDVCLDVYSPTELKTIIPADTEVMEAETSAWYIDNMIEFCKGALEAVRQRGYSIKAIIDQRSLESGK